MDSKPLSKVATGKFQMFEDLKAHQMAREFRKAMDALAHGLPDLEKFGLASRVRRAAVSLTSSSARSLSAADLDAILAEPIQRFNPSPI